MNDTASTNEQEISLRDIYLIIKRNIGLIVLFPIVFAVLAALYVFFVADPVYKSEADLTIQTKSIQSRIEDKIETDVLAAFTTDQVETVATSRPILDKLIEEIRVSDHAPQKWRESRFDAAALAKNLKVKFAKPNTRGLADPSLSTLEVSAPDPQLAADIANAWARETNAALNLLPQERVRASIGILESEIARAGVGLTGAEQRFRAFSDSTNLPLNQAELSSSTAERAGLEALIAQSRQALVQTKAELTQRSRDLSVAASSVGVTADSTQALGVVANGQSLAQVKRNLDAQVATVQQRMFRANEALRRFNATNNAPLLRSRIAQNEIRLVEINAKLQSFESSSKALRSQLAQAQSDLKNQPELLSVQQELLSDPVISAAIQSQDPKLGDLVGLKLQSQEINIIYRDLLQKSIGLQSDLSTLIVEREAIQGEQKNRSFQLGSDRQQLAQLNKLAEPIALEARSAQSAFENARLQVSRLEGIADSQLRGISVENTNPEYQRLRTLVNDLNSGETRLNVTLQGYQTRAKQLDARIANLKRRVASDSVTSARIAQQLELTREQFKTLSQKVVDLKIEQASSKTLAQVLVPAFPASSPTQSSSLVILLAIVLGSLVGLIAPFIVEALRDPNAIPRVVARRVSSVLSAED